MFLELALWGLLPQATEKLADKVLYAGRPGSPREAAFVGFLSEQFASVGHLDLRELRPAAAAAYDIIVCDWELLEDFEEPPALGLGGGLSKPAILLSTVAPTLGVRAKFEYL